MTTDDAEAPPAVSSAPGGRTGPVISDAESVLDNLLDVVRKQAEDILDTARGEAESLTAAAREQVASQRHDLVRAAERQATEIVRQAREAAARHTSSVLAIVEACIAELGRIEEYRANLESLATQLREVVDDVGIAGSETYVEIDPEALQMLAGELGEKACREVIDTFVTELTAQLEELAAAVESDEVKSKKVARILHNLSSGCAIVGAADLAKFCQQVTPNSLDENLDQLVQRGNLVLAEVARLRDGDLSDGDGASLGDDAP